MIFVTKDTAKRLYELAFWWRVEPSQAVAILVKEAFERLSQETANDAEGRKANDRSEGGKEAQHGRDALQ